MSLHVLTYLSVFGRRQVVSRSYFGCIKNVEIARTNFDLLRDAYGVRKGCVLEVLQILHTVLTQHAMAQEVERSGSPILMVSSGHISKC